MARFQSGGNAGTGVSTSVHHVPSIVVFCLVEERLNSRLSEAPSARVQRLLLAPHNIPGVRVAVQVLLQLGPWERIELLDTSDGNIFDLVTGSVFGESGVDLSGAENDAFDLVMVLNRLTMLRIRDNPLEVRLASKVFNVRSGDWVA
jgi:hypothetical protein